jgi:mRNA interferase MazF
MLRGEVGMVELDPTRGDELAKTRPAVIIGADDIGRLALKIVIPLTDLKLTLDIF